jgi:hypothetical protein
MRPEVWWQEKMDEVNPKDRTVKEVNFSKK